MSWSEPESSDAQVVAMMSSKLGRRINKRMKQTGAAILVPRGTKVL